MAQGTVIAKEYASNVSQLRSAIDVLTWDNPTQVYVTDPNGNRLRLELLEKILTDGSIVYNIVVSSDIQK